MNNLWSHVKFSSSVIRQKGESQNGYFKKTKHVKFCEKGTFLTPWYAHMRVLLYMHVITDDLCEVFSLALQTRSSSKFFVFWKRAVFFLVWNFSRNLFSSHKMVSQLFFSNNLATFLSFYSSPNRSKYFKIIIYWFGKSPKHG